MHFSEHPISFFCVCPVLLCLAELLPHLVGEAQTLQVPQFQVGTVSRPDRSDHLLLSFFSFLFGRLRQREPQSGRWEAPKRIRPIKEQQITCASFSSFFFLSSTAVDIRVAPLPRIRQPPADFQSMIADLTFTASSPCFCFKRWHELLMK